jgi:hypothetical protein
VTVTVTGHFDLITPMMSVFFGSPNVTFDSHGRCPDPDRPGDRRHAGHADANAGADADPDADADTECRGPRRRRTPTPSPTPAPSPTPTPACCRHAIANFTWVAPRPESGPVHGHLDEHGRIRAATRSGRGTSVTGAAPQSAQDPALHLRQLEPEERDHCRSRTSPATPRSRSGWTLSRRFRSERRGQALVGVRPRDHRLLVADDGDRRLRPGLSTCTNGVSQAAREIARTTSVHPGAPLGSEHQRRRHPGSAAPARTQTSRTRPFSCISTETFAGRESRRACLATSCGSRSRRRSTDYPNPRRVRSFDLKGSSTVEIQ